MRRRAFAATAISVAVLILVGCAVRHRVRPPGDPDLGVTVRWWGHSCFSFQDSVGRVLLVDPFDTTVGFDTPRVKPDAVLITHDHFDHNALPKPVTPASGVPQTEPGADRRDASPSTASQGPSFPFAVVRSEGITTAAGVEVTGVSADHDSEGGRRHGLTRLYVWTMAGLRFAHLGDIGQGALRPDQVAALAGVDVLFVPVGGRTTVDGVAAAAMVRALQPRVVVPMHYGTPRTRFFEFDPLDKFLSGFDKVVLLPPGGFLVRQADWPEPTTVFVPALPTEGGKTD
ncbi:MAG: MBL fold metallo-hydrolase [Elusimicrobia bacterium]|nr:MBL fold metallo-hydrolase [Elusimicrobiota bacterium]MBP9127637.1 MBL fold metallo-hydrolase [Elusimicrobiota bacterium]